MSDICNLCGKGATLMCQRCQEAYCSTNCQILDWRVHKKVCIQLPALVPIKDAFNNSLNHSANHSFGGDVPRSRTPTDKNINFRRNLSRNPLKIPQDENSTPLKLERNDSASSPAKSLPEIDFTLKPKVIPIPTSKEISMKSNASQCSKAPSSTSAAWRTPYPYKEGVFFDVLVQYVEEGKASGIVWVTDLKYESALRKLLSEINRNIDINSERCSDEDISLGSLVAAPFEKLFYRAEIIAITEAAKTAMVHLIDYGNMVEVAAKELRSPIPIMRNLNAYAFRIRYTKPVELETVLTIRIVKTEPDGVAVVEEKAPKKPVPLGLTAEAFEASPNASLVKISDCGKFALLCLMNELAMDQVQEMNMYFDTDAAKACILEEPPKDGDFVVARTLHGWSRALTISTYHNEFLVYLFDVGRIALVEQVMAVPEKFTAMPMLVFGVELQKVLTKGNNFSDCLFKESPYTIKAQPCPKPSNGRTPCCIIAADGSRIAEVEAFNYFGKCQDIGVRDWIEPLVAGSAVHVTYAVTHCEIFISLVSTKMYPNIFTAAAEDCETLPPAKCNKGDLVLAKFKDEYIRARALEAVQGDSVKVVNVDAGFELTVSSQSLRKPNIFVLSCPYHTRKVKLMYLSNVASPYKDNKALEMLQQCQKKGAEFLLEFDSSPEQGVELVYKTAEKQSLNKQLLPLLFEKGTNVVVESTEVKIAEVPPVEAGIVTPPPSPKTEKKECSKFTLKDLEIIPITCGDNVPVMVLDSSTISKGYISGCDVSNTDFLKKLESKYLPMISKYCAALPAGLEYCPSEDEICLAVFDVDKEWYRALCLSQLKDGMFYVMFLDYGNMCKVHKSNIRQITPELMFPSNANMCIFDGLGEKVKPEQCEKFILASQSDPKIIANVSKVDHDSYLLKLKNMDKYF